MEEDGADHRPPQRALAAEDRHQDHPDAEGGAGEGDLARIDEADDVADEAAGEAEEHGADAPGDDLVAGGAQAQRLRLVLVVADGVAWRGRSAWCRASAG